ncbi:MAG: response regulator [Tangfeifania sp.]
MDKKPDKNPKIILIAEDDDTSYALLQVYLAKGNYRLLRAVNGKQTIEMVKENPGISLILMDLKMPVMDGYEATREIKKMNKDLPVIAQTAYALAGDSQKALDAGCDDYVTKPISKEELLDKVERNLKN